MALREATADEIAREIARETWKGAAKIYQTGIDEAKVNELFNKWWSSNASTIMRRIGYKFHEGVEDGRDT